MNVIHKHVTKRRETLHCKISYHLNYADHSVRFSLKTYNVQAAAQQKILSIIKTASSAAYKTTANSTFANLDT